MEIISRDGIWTMARKEINGKTYDIKIKHTMEEKLTGGIEFNTTVWVTLDGKEVHETSVEHAVFKDVCEMFSWERMVEEAESGYTEGPNKMIKIIKHNGNWTVCKAKYEGKYYNIEIKHFEEPSKFGIKKGRISKMCVRKDGKSAFCLNYDRGWDIRPRSKAAKAIYEEIVAMYN